MSGVYLAMDHYDNYDVKMGDYPFMQSTKLDKKIYFVYYKGNF